MASSLLFIVGLCLTTGLWSGANAHPEDDPCCDTCKICPAGWTQFDGHCYMYRHTPMVWADAEVACVAIGGNLASIPDKAVYEFIRRIINTSTNKDGATWVGGNDSSKEGVWMWSDGSKFDFQGWPVGEPNNAGKEEHCMELNLKEKDFPNDTKCSSEMPFVCRMRL
ncbi:hypothetical protein PBY51_000933 [Eleginops maclovinus]|uniref:C-type lectin domain-containing protein n=2 Tax=Eleginops maclovinus TaxID=56733 RepID=A0AAN7XQF8_ELEMC|nr:hypothetical protein PBY51_000933 [Eleginops maclovinus]